jgi:AraC-like DNA-binding protein
LSAQAAGPATSGPSLWLRIGNHQWQPSRLGDFGDVSVIVCPDVPLVGCLGDQPLHLEPPLAALYIPDPLAAHTALNVFDGLLLRLESHRLERAAALLSGQSWSSRRFGALLQQPVTLTASEASKRQLRRLLAVARLLDPAEGATLDDTRMLALDEVLDRLVVLCFWGERLLSGSERSGAMASDRESILDDLVDWIRANSHRPLHLAELEQRSGYSERSLRNAFQERFGCPPKQWIRRTRMESAHRRLLDPAPGDSVSSIAQEHGYQHVSQFSRDFRCVFGQRPSLVMRQARRSLA